jgi:hypothetical protein
MKGTGNQQYEGLCKIKSGHFISRYKRKKRNIFEWLREYLTLFGLEIKRKLHLPGLMHSAVALVSAPDGLSIALTITVPSSGCRPKSKSGVSPFSPTGKRSFILRARLMLIRNRLFSARNAQRTRASIAIARAHSVR